MDSSSLQSSPCQTTSRSEDKQKEQGGTVEQDGGMGAQVKKEGPGSTVGKQKCSKEVYFALLPDKYEPLIEELEEEETETSSEEKKKRKEEKKRKKKQRYKKYRKVRGGDFNRPPLKFVS